MIINANRALDENNLSQAETLIKRIEKEILKLEKNEYTIQLSANLGGLMIDYGTWKNDFLFVNRGTQYALEAVESLPEKRLLLSHLYNLANGYSSIRKFKLKKSFDKGSIPEEYLEEKRIYRRALDFASSKKLLEHETQILPELLINYGNMLDTIGRPVEALDFYEQALNINPAKPEVLTNKAITLKHLALRAHGHTHLFIQESKRLLDLALENAPHPQLKKDINLHLDQIQDFIDHHDGNLDIEYYKSPKPISKFHVFLQDFCFRHGLFLTPTTLLGEQEHQYYGDPLYISGMNADLERDSRTERYITFFNQIKQDFIFSRYLLVQSQYRADHAEVIDQDVDYYYPLDYSLYSSYIEMLKVSYRLAADTLDKIAYFIKDYCGIKSLKTRDTNFRYVFSTYEDPYTLREELLMKKNNYLFGLLDLSLDLRKNEYFDFVIDRRNALTHRFLSIRAELFTEDHNQEKIPNVQLDAFIRETIQVLRLLKAAIIYLILYVDVNERSQYSNEIIIPYFSPKADGVLRWSPGMGNNT